MLTDVIYYNELTFWASCSTINIANNSFELTCEECTLWSLLHTHTCWKVSYTQWPSTRRCRRHSHIHLAHRVLIIRSAEPTAHSKEPCECVFWISVYMHTPVERTAHINGINIDFTLSLPSFTLTLSLLIPLHHLVLVHLLRQLHSHCTFICSFWLYS